MLLLCQVALAQGLQILGSEQAAPFWGGFLDTSDARGLSPSSELTDGTELVGIYELHREGRSAWVHGVLLADVRLPSVRARTGGPRGLAPVGQFDGTVLGMRHGTWNVHAHASGVVEFPETTLRMEGSDLVIESFELTHRCSVHVSAEWVGRCGGGALQLRLGLWRDLPRAELTLYVQAPEALAFPAGIDLVFRGKLPLASLAVEESSTTLKEEPTTSRFPDSGGFVVAGAKTASPLYLRHQVGFEGPGAVTLDPGVGETRVHWLMAGTTLLRGEGRILRLMLEAGRDPAEPGLAIGESFLRSAHGRLGRWPAHVLADRVRQEVDRFLVDPARGRILQGEGAGDYRFSASDVGNLEYDTVLGLLTFAILNRDRRAYLAAWAAGDHQLSYDRDAAGTGLFFSHGPGHRAAPVELGHHWTEGLLLLSRGIPEPHLSSALDEVLKAQPRAVLSCDLKKELPRSLSWALLALSVQLEGNRSDRSAREALIKLRRHILDHQHSSGWLDLGSGTGQHFVVSPFVQVGILLPALARSLILIPDAYGQGAMGRLIEAALRDAIRENRESVRLEVARSLRVPRRGAEAPSFGSTLEDEQVALVLAGLQRARDRLRADPAVRRLRRALGQNLRLDQKTYVGPELSILLRALPWL
jgi:hypothetical protein